MGDDDLKVSKETVSRLTKGINAATDELRSIGDETGAIQGTGFDNLAMTKREVGHKRLADDFEDFAERWEWGVRAVMKDANEIAERLGLAAGLLHEQDTYTSETFKVAGNAFSPTGNPHLSEEEVGQLGWWDIAKQPEKSDVPQPDGERGGGGAG